MFKVYVLHSASFDKIYIGFSFDLETRILYHNELGKKGFTLRFRPWTLVYTETLETKSDAMKRERELKSAQGRKFIWH
jgi:putative endonuclease